ncbi:TetR/AcrR family transcriptional regulator [Amycolatopsis sp. 195334CR]|uniref:TetR/AcrR family transcriptional regulator n=1 Tax=Amycolatopsis sp. 195334CR TaxID=2814588 RepID=UPI001A8E1087|nr:TetR family transcriptional regulator C-terminal domain-containing protein [Amycolatopsis sp. 195334CR]MBN6040436.1 TetR family transcriptional regulator C-terminal domain-containing protein [Amycolatopsis sp. 195334CR]
MPKRVDHEQRRREITGALWEIARAEGLGAVTLRRVAAEAGMSMNLVQYYFPAKEEMLEYGLRHLIEVASDRLRGEIEAASGPRAVLRAALLGLLAVDERSRLLTAVHHAYLAHAITDARVAALLNRIPRELAGQLAPALDHPAALTEVDGLLAMVTGLALGLLVGTYTTAEAVALVDHRLTTLFG